MKKVLVAGACGYLIRTFTSQKIYGPAEFFLTVMAMDMVGTPCGKKRLKDFFEENATLG